MTGALRARAASLAKLIELLVYPSFCRLCAEPLGEPGERVVCRACLAKLSPRGGPLCPQCGRFHEGEGEDHLCSRCLERAPAFSLHRSCGVYGGTLKEVILLFKYRKYAPLSRPLAGFAERCLASDTKLWEGADFLVSVPLHPARKRERGFNQSRLLARDLGRLRGMALREGCLVKAKNVPPQAGLHAAEREANVKKAYAVRRRRKISGKTLILIDDVTTTGATLRECARVLLEAGAKEVRAITLAQA
ncbi:MAG: ComF family protein [Candidatus Aminicenantes bacterium]|nr:ComF family protein [Candidatus Aminicenantes bacterium]